ncbi:hypothetical protein TTHERM_00190700 (macronuclear) [Tetrahymena thermophila SB210]|uniref:Uncharacterized protein n=1 Tax=Tetrahymena thermophila (strain SB210) TaxID=312017 RepID=I7MJI9_TETTS|nr:hypothetical protein TTHERM_00190700 [Tetrahymena thermophila SB210]EAR96402.2 hypothetical protein TTHERM_00190700 [Tetrahymena thermophila SB210]|eukprot:XP_001016647.2 hypothetical protein TTHERM_00190700 [Tetrahymena thermophila SB210]
MQISTDMNLQNEILVVQYQEDSLYYFDLQKQFTTIDEAYKFIENTNLNEENFQNFRVAIKSNEYHVDFINEIQNSWQNQIEAKKKDKYFQQEEEEEKYVFNLHFQSLTLQMIQNLESFLIKITENVNFIECLYNPTKIIINNLKQIKMQEFFLIFNYINSIANSIAYSKQIKIIQNLFDKCPSTINVDNLNIETSLISTLSRQLQTLILMIVMQNNSFLSLKQNSSFVFLKNSQNFM